MRRIALINTPARFGLLLLLGWLTISCGSEPTLVPIVTTPTAEPAEAATTPAPPTTPAVTPQSQVAETATPEPTASQAANGDPPPGTLELKTAVVKLDRDGAPSVLNEGEEMASCVGPDENCYPVYGMYFTPNQAAYIYAFQQDSTGKIDTLFPNEEYSEQSNPVPPNTVVWVPKDTDHWLYLDENVGQESIYVVASAEKIDDLEKLAGNVQGVGRGSPAPVAQLVSWLEDRSGRGVGGVRKEAVSARLPGGNPEAESLQVSVLEANGENQFVFQITFQHVASAVLQ